jgi:hypothetical protein
VEDISAKASMAAKGYNDSYNIIAIKRRIKMALMDS